ncbi:MULTISPECIES: hypothetical protein [unclassified Pseudomonas]|uniref:hypothetical protein n=1 Tax=unclassified Pseudomonas TaxID=196821 RepID=UPI00119B7D52|nr:MULTISPECIES: hypothetical protein [unclassified Pseudomonas]TWC22815.1 hypothetical protein FBY00_10143 [Pseudomonas sp. SJZ075]TWC24922.1 hypothetical protein FBX99_102332 [Pseudomonas sp. SJZ074]TWC38305.1 hypothetical protein FBY02_101332 [Pseudomonas sp. SJZ078]TWC40861.1 hypothetical protein FBY06_10343 [Pseudomonas sp. SJZ085]TWC58895.1 hypothetical protein FBY11_101332 [Pseudomonas sp. SJZ124]
MKPTRTLNPAMIFLGVACMTFAGLSMAITPKQGATRAPDISGTWERTPDDWFGENPDDPVHPGGPMDLKEPYASQYADLKKKEAAANEAGTPLATTSARCLPEGMPVLMAALFPIQIIYDDKQVVVLGEYLQQVRRIFLNEAMPPKEKLDPTYQGHSRGHWEGDTLVVETLGVRTDDVAFYGVPHSKDMKITERLRLTAPNHLEDQVLIEDPQVLNTPYRFTFEYKRSDYRIQEYVCENNQIVIDSEGKTSLRRD